VKEENKTEAATTNNEAPKEEKEQAK